MLIPRTDVLALTATLLVVGGGGGGDGTALCVHVCVCVCVCACCCYAWLLVSVQPLTAGLIDWLCKCSCSKKRGTKKPRSWYCAHTHIHFAIHPSQLTLAETSFTPVHTRDQLRAYIAELCVCGFTCMCGFMCVCVCVCVHAG